MSLWDPVLDGPSKHETFQQRNIRRFARWAEGTRWAVEDKLKAMVRAGRDDDAIAEARTCNLNPCICLSAIAAEQARLGRAARALLTTETIADPEARAGALLDVAEECRRSGDHAAADAALASASAAATKVRGQACPQRFRDDAFRIMAELRERVLDGKISDDQRAAKEPVERIHVPGRQKGMAAGKPDAESDYLGLRRALLDFIAEFANWDLSTNRFFLDASRALTQSAHEALGGAPGTRPLVVDPFAGGGSIPLEALRVGADAFASDLNPVAVLLNKVVLEYIPKYGQRLADEVRKQGRWVKEHAEKELAAFYPKDPDGATSIAYLWARTIKCEGPGCGAEVPLMRSLWLAKKGRRSTALRIVPHPSAKRVDFEIIENAKAADVDGGTVQRGSATHHNRRRLARRSGRVAAADSHLDAAAGRRGRGRRRCDLRLPGAGAGGLPAAAR
jgi:hypothetical protein